MIAPGSIGDWALFAGMLGSLSALAVCVASLGAAGDRDAGADQVASLRRAQATAPNRVPT